ncbi:MAG: zinc ribbon domain-containing protein [Aliishimia sp.]
MKHQMHLDYSIPEGALKPYFEALRVGNALASACQKCGHVAFPPRAMCASCGSDQMGWIALPGTAHVIHRTDGAAASFALVKFAGADTLSTVELLNASSIATTGTLEISADDQAGLRLKLTEIPEGLTDV